MAWLFTGYKFATANLEGHKEMHFVNHLMIIVYISKEIQHIEG